MTLITFNLSLPAGDAALGYMRIYITQETGGGSSPCRFYSPNKADKGYIKCSQPTVGRTVSITSPYNQSLTLCTVKVLGKCCHDPS